jgi:hypothetical protein
MTSKDKNFESFCYVWLDDDTNRLKTKIDTQKQLGNCLKIFEDENQCEQYIRNASTSNRIVLIVSDHLGQKIIPHIHRLQQVSSIYVYGTNNDSTEEWTKDYSKVNKITLAYCFFFFIYYVGKRRDKRTQHSHRTNAIEL